MQGHSAVPVSAPPKREALRSLLADGAWHHMKELRAVGGWRYGARLLELRRCVGGFPLITEKRTLGADNEFEYRAFRAPVPAPPTTSALPLPKHRARERIAQLADENTALKRRIAELEGAAHVS